MSRRRMLEKIWLVIFLFMYKIFASFKSKPFRFHCAEVIMKCFKSFINRLPKEITKSVKKVFIMKYEPYYEFTLQKFLSNNSWKVYLKTILNAENVELIKSHAKFCAIYTTFSLCEFLFFGLCATFNKHDTFYNFSFF